MLQTIPTLHLNCGLHTDLSWHWLLSFLLHKMNRISNICAVTVLIYERKVHQWHLQQQDQLSQLSQCSSYHCLEFQPRMSWILLRHFTVNLDYSLLVSVPFASYAFWLILHLPVSNSRKTGFSTVCKSLIFLSLFITVLLRGMSQVVLTIPKPLCDGPVDTSVAHSHTLMWAWLRLCTW